MNLYEQKAADGLKQLRLNIALEHLDAAAQQAAAEQWSYSHFLGYLMEGEISQRRVKTVELHLQFAHLPYRKKIEDFDFSCQPSIDRRLMDELLTGRFLSEGRNVVFLGPPGVGKTHLAIALAIRMIELGHRIYFTNVMEMARKLSLAVSQNRLAHVLKNHVLPKLLVLDEVGYLPLDPTQASLVFQMICQRYEKALPTILTSNLAFADWGQTFANNPIMASAALDRLLHRSTVINIRGNSYRLKEKRQAGAQPLIPPSTNPFSPSCPGPREDNFSMNINKPKNLNEHHF